MCDSQIFGYLKTLATFVLSTKMPITIRISSFRIHKVSMYSAYCIEAVDSALQYATRLGDLFGGKPISFGSYRHQNLVVIPEPI